jgi:hypothetical protein
MEKAFMKFCNKNFQSEHGGKDLVQFEAYSMNECINLCATYKPPAPQQGGCVGVTWTYRGPQGTGDNFCWLKSATGSQNTFNDMESAILLEPELA